MNLPCVSPDVTWDGGGDDDTDATVMYSLGLGGLTASVEKCYITLLF